MRKLAVAVLLAAAFACAEDKDKPERPKPVPDDEAKAALEQFEKDYKSDKLEDREKAAVALGKVYHPQTAKALLSVLTKDKESKVRGAAALGLGMQKDPEVVPALCEAMDANREMPEAMAVICGVLGAFGDKRAVHALESDLWKTKTGDVIDARIAALGKIRDKSAIDALLELTCIAPAAALAPYALPIAKALHDLTDQNFGTDRDAWKKWWREHKETFVFPAEEEKDPKKKGPRRQR